MKNNNATSLLEDETAQLEQQRDEEFEDLKNEFNKTFESLISVDLLSNTLNKISKMPELKSKLTNYIIALITGYITNKLIVGQSHSTSRKILGTLVQYVVTFILARYLKPIISLAFDVLQRTHKTKVQPAFQPVGL